MMVQWTYNQPWDPRYILNIVYDLVYDALSHAINAPIIFYVQIDILFFNIFYLTDGHYWSHRFITTFFWIGFLESGERGAVGDRWSCRNDRQGVLLRQGCEGHGVLFLLGSLASALVWNLSRKIGSLISPSCIVNCARQVWSSLTVLLGRAFPHSSRNRRAWFWGIKWGRSAVFTVSM